MPKPLTRAERRAIDTAANGLNAVALGRLVAVGFALRNAWHGDWLGFAILLCVCGMLGVFLPRRDPELEARLRELAGK